MVSVCCHLLWERAWQVVFRIIFFDPRKIVIFRDIRNNDILFVCSFYFFETLLHSQPLVSVAQYLPIPLVSKSLNSVIFLKHFCQQFQFLWCEHFVKIQEKGGNALAACHCCQQLRTHLGIFQYQTILQEVQFTLVFQNAR